MGNPSVATAAPALACARPIRPLRDGVLVGLVLFLTAGLSIVLLYHEAFDAYVAEVHAGLLRKAQAVAALVDGDLHRTFTTPEQEDSDDYHRAVEPLRRVLNAVEGLRFVYTVVLVDDKVHFVLDATPPGDADGDGVEDHSCIMELYEDADADPAMLTALREGRATASAQPTTDKWGSLISGYAPFFDSNGRLAGVVGIDITAEEYQRRLAAVGHTALWGLLPALLVSTIVGVGTYWTRRGALRMEVERHRAERELRAQTLALKAANIELESQKGSLQAQREEVEAINPELERARQAAEVANHTKTAFLANTSHEIRTPMTAILGFAEHLLDTTLSESERMDAVQTIRRNGEFLLNIVNDILDLSKIEAGRLDLERIRCSPFEIVGDVCSTMRVRAAEKGLRLDSEYEGPIPATIETDPTRLRQILINLIGNAIKFTEHGGVRMVTRLVEQSSGARSVEPVLQFDVIDSGVGLSEQQVTRLFQPFSQADTSTSRKFGGSGLGLAISQRLARGLRGDIELVDTKPGRGTHFRATVGTGSLDAVEMLTQPCESTVVRPRAADQAQPDAGQLTGRILLAEDGPDNQRLISLLLTRAGAEVKTAENGQIAVETARAASDAGRPFDVILMDIQMPVLDGYDATRLLRQAGYSGPIIALTAHAMAQDREKCLRAGCDDYASKPIDRRTLIKTIQRCLASCGSAHTRV